MLLFISALITVTATLVSADCVKPVTTASGSFAPNKPFCKGDLIFEENFNNLNTNLWHHETSMSGINGEFEWYVNNRSNSFVQNGQLHIRPTLTQDVIGDITKCNIQINPCTGGCSHICSKDHPAKPIQSARMTSINSFQFKYGKAEIVAKLPTGDWLWPAIWFMPTKSVYGDWPRSGEIDLVESKGNAKHFNNAGKNNGVEQFGTTLHFGSSPAADAWYTSSFSRQSPSGNGWNNGFHKYQLEWTPEHMSFSVDNVQYATIPAGDGFYKRSHSTGENPWKSGTKMAPFDQEFYFIFNLAVGGTNGFFPETGNQNGAKPWKNNSGRPDADFWEGRKQWLPTWNFKNNAAESSLIIDSAKVWAI